MEKQVISIPRIELEWSKWYPWAEFKINARKREGIKKPGGAGVYEVKYKTEKERLHIGETGRPLKKRLYEFRRALIQGTTDHSAGSAMHAASVDTSRLVIRWAETNRPKAVEEELHRQYREKFGKLPKYDRHT